MLRAAFASLLVFLLIFLLGTPLLLYANLTGDTDIIYRVGVSCARVVVWLAGVRLDVRGREKIPADRAVVFMANHQSNVDPPVIVPCLPPVLILAKRQAFRIPVLGRAMRLHGFIPVERDGDRTRAIEAVDRAAAALLAGKSFLVFPEGTRSPDGRLRPFKKGAFILAMKAGAPIVPVSLSGATRIMQKGELAIHPGTIRITFHNPVPTANRSPEDRDQVMEEVRQGLLAGLQDDEWPPEELAKRQA
ncbi:MAG TPA: lysophospholipid acyltransferase family protein [Terriglobia bacterium]|nr:lysophospholipid acyltransferase family protein [Terriglobia bacterium]